MAPLEESAAPVPWAERSKVVGGHHAQDASAAFGEHLRHWRVRAGLTQEELAERAGLTGDTIGALEQGTRRYPYPHTVAALADALGLLPEERARLAASARRPFDARSDAPAGVARWLPPSNVPAPRFALVGRERELALLRDLVAGPTARLVTVVGGGGSGKTALGLRVAYDLRRVFSDRVWVLELASLSDPTLIVGTLTSLLGMRDCQADSAVPRIAALLQERGAALVLDNCEHLVNACASLAGQLLDACPGLRVLATSREPLLIPGERQLRLGPLEAPELIETASVEAVARFAAVQLLVERVQAADSSFALSPGNAASVARLCARLGGLPLAIELAAARVPVLGLDQLAQRLDEGLWVLSGGSRVAPTRQQTLIATLDWSYALLGQPERAVFRRLAVFAGGCDLEAAEAVCSGEDVAPTEVLDRLAELVHRSLVLGEGLDGSARYRLLEPVRQYARQRLEAEGEGALSGAASRHLTYCLGLAERAAPELRGAAQVAWLRRLDQERDNLRAALRHAADQHDAPSLLRLGVALVPFWEVRGYHDEGRRWLEAGLAGAGADARLQVRAVLGLGQLAYWQSDVAAATACFQRAAAQARALSDQPTLATALTWLGAIRVLEVRYAEAEALLAEGLRLHEAVGDQAGTAWALFQLGRAVGNAGDLERANGLLEASLTDYRALGDLRLAATAAMLLGTGLALLGEHQERSAAMLREGLNGLDAVGDRAYLLSGLLALASVAADTEQPARAARLLGAAQTLHATVGASLSPLARSTSNELLDRVRPRLTAAELELALRQGRAFSTKEALAEAERAVTRMGACGSTAAIGTTGQAGALTPREREVARRLAAGQTDRQIAAELDIAPRTVGVHVHHVLSKLELRSRWQVGPRSVDTANTREPPEQAL